MRVASVLQALNPEIFAENHCLFGGGTAIVLSCGEYRESIDIDFLVSSRPGYQALRQALTGEKGIQSIVRPGMELELVRGVRADQYGIRTMLRVAQTEIKFGIVLEARISLDPPSPDHTICGIPALSPVDLATEKLLANSDRWGDDSVFSRDLIDLAMMNPPKAVLLEALKKAENAYGKSVRVDLAKAAKTLGGRKGRLDACMDALQMHHTPTALLWKRIKSLARIVA